MELPNAVRVECKDKSARIEAYNFLQTPECQVFSNLRWMCTASTMNCLRVCKWSDSFFGQLHSFIFITGISPLSSFFLTLVLILVLGPICQAQDAEKTLFDESLVQNWGFFSGKKDATLGDTWNLRDVDGKRILVCSGEPYGYLRTKRAYRNFRMRMKWRFPKDQNGNSGVLVYTTGEDRIWPQSIQIQLHQPEAGSAFPSGGAKSDNELRNVPMLSKPVNHWNNCVITSQEGRVTVIVNDQELGQVTGCEPREGFIALQSEGSEIHFADLVIEPLEEDPAVVETSDAPNPQSPPEEKKKPLKD